MSDSKPRTKGFSIDNMVEPLLNSLPDIIHSVDKDGRIVYTNKRASEILEYTHDELIGFSIFELYAPEIQNQVKKGFKTLKQTGDMAVRESLLRTKSGKIIPVEIRSFGVYDTNGEFLKTFSILRDIREIKEMRENLMHAERLTGIGQLASCVVHDIHNPLMVIQLYTEMLLQDATRYLVDASAGEVTEYLQQMQKAIEKIQKLLSHLRNFSRRQADIREKTDINDLIDDALFMIMNKLVSHNIIVKRRNKEHIYPLVGCVIQLEQVLMNLFSNACDAMRKAEKRHLCISVDRCTHDEVEYYRCTVTDTGAGIEKEKLDKIFNPFFTTKRQGEGTGLGLAICRDIIEKHDGRIIVETDSERGTTFRVMLPIGID